MDFCKDFFDRSMRYTKIDHALFQKYDVKKGLRNEDGTGVCIGLTRIADVVGYEKINGQKKAVKGELTYRGLRIQELIERRRRHGMGYEEVCFLLLFGYLPSISELSLFEGLLNRHCDVSEAFVKTNVHALPTTHLMNKLQQMILMLYNEDSTADDTAPYATLLKGLGIQAKLPSLVAYAYFSKQHWETSEIHEATMRPFSYAQRLLWLLKKDHTFTEKEAELLDIMLMLHADHGGGNNSTFTNVVISSSGSDLYSTMSASIASLKGGKHGGANIHVVQMMDQIKKAVGLQADAGEIEQVLMQILDKKFYDRSGLIYGMGHAIYTLSDPRSEILKTYAASLAIEKGMQEEFQFYQRVEQCAKAVILQRKKIQASSNIDFYSGFVYQMLGISKELYTPLFVCSRMIGWLAHNIENKLYDGRIMRPATRYIKERKGTNHDEGDHSI